MTEGLTTKGHEEEHLELRKQISRFEAEKKELEKRVGVTAHNHMSILAEGVAKGRRIEQHQIRKALKEWENDKNLSHKRVSFKEHFAKWLDKSKDEGIKSILIHRAHEPGEPCDLDIPGKRPKKGAKG